jgi:hypothetical protein
VLPGIEFEVDVIIEVGVVIENFAKAKKINF